MSYALCQCPHSASGTLHPVRSAPVGPVAVARVLEPMSICLGTSGAWRVKAPGAYQRSYVPWKIRCGPSNTRWMPYSKKAWRFFGGPSRAVRVRIPSASCTDICHTRHGIRRRCASSDNSIQSALTIFKRPIELSSLCNAVRHPPHGIAKPCASCTDSLPGARRRPKTMRARDTRAPGLGHQRRDGIPAWG
jgi:hypothetical protein